MPRKSARQGFLSSLIVLPPLLAFFPSLASAHLTGALPQCASDSALRFQPLMDWDQDTCYYTSALDPEGSTNPGLISEVEEWSVCRHPDRLKNSNTYVRQRCNHGWCAYLYDNYAEMDHPVGHIEGGHRHEWEHVIVWTQRPLGATEFESVYSFAYSAHGKWYHQHAPNEGEDENGPFAHDSHVRVVAHHIGGLNSSLRPADDDDIDDGAENATQDWVLAPLISVEVMDPALKDILLSTDWNGPRHKLTDERFEAALRDTKPKMAHQEGFDETEHETELVLVYHTDGQAPIVEEVKSDTHEVVPFIGNSVVKRGNRRHHWQRAGDKKSEKSVI